MPGSLTTPSRPTARDSATSRIASRLVTLSALGKCGFRGSMASLHDPLPTLRPAPHGTQRTARGRCDSLRLHRRGLAPPAPCRFSGALPIRLNVDTLNVPNTSWPGSTAKGFSYIESGSDSNVLQGSSVTGAKVWAAPLVRQAETGL